MIEKISPLVEDNQQALPLLSELPVVAAEYAHRLGLQPPDTEFFETLFEAASSDTSTELSIDFTPSNFTTLLAVTANHEEEIGETTAVRMIGIFAESACVSFAETSTNEDDMTNTARRVEKSISTFIEENTGLGVLELLTKKDLQQVMEIYNPNNLLYLASQSVDAMGNIPEDMLCMLYRYRIVVQRLASCFNNITHLQSGKTTKEPKDGERTWAGDIHEYGHREDGQIVGSEYRDFSERDEPEVSNIVVDGINLRVGRRGVGWSND